MRQYVHYLHTYICLYITNDKEICFIWFHLVSSGLIWSHLASSSFVSSYFSGTARPLRLLCIHVTIRLVSCCWPEARWSEKISWWCPHVPFLTNRSIYSCVHILLQGLFLCGGRCRCIHTIVVCVLYYRTGSSGLVAAKETDAYCPSKLSVYGICCESVCCLSVIQIFLPPLPSTYIWPSILFMWLVLLIHLSFYLIDCSFVENQPFLFASQQQVLWEMLSPLLPLLLLVYSDGICMNVRLLACPSP